MLLEFLYDGIRVLGCQNFYLFLYCAFVTMTCVEGKELEYKFKNYTQVWAVPGKDAELPCNVTPPTPSDSVTMIFWFKDSTVMPIYSLDARRKPLEKALQLAGGYDVGSRSYFVRDHPSNARLTIKNITFSDEGIFRCRVDFLNSPTRNSLINLTLIEQPSEPIIHDVEGKLIKSEAGPFLEGRRLFLSCHVNGGRPAPTVTWWYNGAIIDNEMESKGESATTVNHLAIPRLSRSFKGAKLECRASSMESAGVAIRQVPVVVYLRPSKVKIVSPNELMSSSKTHMCKCETSGSYPPAKLTWLLNGKAIKGAIVTEEENKSFSSSIISLTVEPEDDGKDLVCRADNPRFPGGSLEDRRQIHVAYPPKVAVRLDSGATSHIREGTDVELRCDTAAKPNAHTYSWYHDGHLVAYDEAEGYFPSDETLSLRNIKKSALGEYACSATNSEGETYSPPFHLAIQYAPRCKVGFEEMRFGLSVHDETIIQCHVDAVPEVIRFSWTYNTSKGVLPVQGAKVQNRDGISTLYFTPGTADIESLSCWASNSIGRQERPCLFYVVPAHNPESPRNCKLQNTTTGSLEVVCLPGEDGGLEQSFVLEVSDVTATHNPAGITTLSDQGEQATPIYRVLGESPVFRLHSLKPGRDYQFTVYAQNAKGRSKPPVILPNVRVEVPGGTVREGSSGTTKEEPLPIKQNLTLILLGLAVAAVLLIVSIVTVATALACRKQSAVVVRRDRRRSRPPDELELSEAGFGEGFQRRSAQYRASLYAQEIEREGYHQQTTGPDLILAPANFPPQSSEY